MSRIRPRYPQLMKLGDPPTIVAQCCNTCGHRSFPPDPYGCVQCGAEPDQLHDDEVASTGTIRALATVHRHHHPSPETPFTVATVVLDDGLTLKGVLSASSEAAVGSRVQGTVVLWDVDADGTDVVDLRFTVPEDH